VILFLIIILVSIATWYYRLTWLAYKKTNDVINEKYPNKPFQENVLDDIML